jgi:diadenosine tetraphosphatase ApaH/serine/threonine PP2A family protein phosphatase
VRYLVISDIHANLEALEAVLDAASGEYDAVLSLGDQVGYGPNPNEVIERVLALEPEHSLVGNHDLAALGDLDLALFNPFAREAAEWTARQLRPEFKAQLKALQPQVASNQFELFHASPRDPVWEYMESAWQGPPNFEIMGSDLAMVGHTHVPRIFRASQGRVTVFEPDPDEVVPLISGERLIINPGGVGQPRDGDPRASFAIYDVSAQTITFRRVPYEIEVTQRKIHEAGLPQILAERLPLGR